MVLIVAEDEFILLEMCNSKAQALGKTHPV